MEKITSARLVGGVLTPGGTAVTSATMRRPPLTFDFTPFPEDMVNACRYPLPDHTSSEPESCASVILEAPTTSCMGREPGRAKRALRCRLLP